jgi:hypothetical protein
MTTRLDGPRFSVRTWKEATPGCAAPLMWYARIVPVSEWTAPFTNAEGERQAVSTCPDTPRLTLAGAVEAALAKWTALWGGVERLKDTGADSPGRAASPGNEPQGSEVEGVGTDGASATPGAPSVGSR